MREGSTIDDNEAAGTAVDTTDVAVRLTGIGKRFPGVVANDDGGRCTPWSGRTAPASRR
jgi:hypothetical protein